jgi:hypothetical protein
MRRRSKKKKAATAAAALNASDVSQSQFAPTDAYSKYPLQVGVGVAQMPYSSPSPAYATPPPDQPELQGSTIASGHQNGGFAGSELQGGYVERPHEMGHGHA